MAIGTPGPTKRKMVADFEALWSRAKTALKDADEIFFVGYRFPPTDSESRRRMLSAISENTGRMPRYHIVLGPDTNSKDVARLAGLLKFTGRVPESNPDSKILRHPLYAEDFFSVYNAESFFKTKVRN